MRKEEAYTFHGFLFQLVAPHSNSMSSSKAYRVFTAILLQTENDAVFKLVRRLAMKTISSIIDFSGHEHEISLWVDGVTDATAATFGKLLDATHKVTIQHATVVSNAWNNHFASEEIPPAGFTPLLSLALIASGAEDFPPEFMALIRNIATKLLLAQSDTRALAALLKYVFDARVENGTMIESLEELYQCTTAILHRYVDLDKAERETAEKAFGRHHFHTVVTQLVEPGEKSIASRGKLDDIIMDCDEIHEVASSIFLQCIHHLHQLKQHAGFDPTTIHGVMAKFLPYVLQVSYTCKGTTKVSSILDFSLIR